MLNEGYALYKSLERCRIVEAQSFTRRHRDLANPGKSDGLIIGLDEKGNVARIEFRNKLEMVRLWTTTKGNHGSFPAIKLQRPIWKVGAEDILRSDLKKMKKNDQEKRKVLLNQSFELNITHIEVDSWQRLHERVQELQPFFATDSREFVVIHDLMTRFQLVVKFETFLRGLVKQLKETRDDIPYSVIENILIGNKEDKKKREYRAEVRLILDVSDWDNGDKFSNRVASPHLEPFVSDCLFRFQSSLKKESSDAHRLSGLSGNPLPLVDDKFPQPTLPIGKTYLFSAAANIPCLTRYGKISTEIFPVAKDEANEIQDSLRWITHEDRKGKTWYPIPSFKDGDSELLLVYLENKPNLNANKAHLLGGVSKNDFTESDYAAISSVAIDALKGEQILKANALIRIFALRKADPGRTQVSLQRVYTISELIRADKEWQEAAKNLPGISLPFFRKELEKSIVGKEKVIASIIEFLKDKEEKVTFLSPRCPFPADLVRLTQKQWFQPKKNEGKGQGASSKISGVSLGDIYDIFFARDNEKQFLTEHLLRTTLQRTQALLIGFGQADHKKEMNNFKPDARFTVLTTVSAFAIYLYKLGIKKEEYMKSSLFNVGRFLSLVDTLHFEYCRHVRGGFPEKEEKEWRKAIPPQLLGNTHFRIALDNPATAFARLSERIAYYQAWTKKESPKDGNWAHWAMAEIGKVSLTIQDAIDERKLPSITTDADKAQILLGYLSRSERKTVTDSESTISKHLETK